MITWSAPCWNLSTESSKALPRKSARSKKDSALKVLIFHQYFGTSEDAGAGIRTYEIGRRMVRRGDSVTIITGNSIYFSGKKAARQQGFPWSREKVDGIDVIRVHIPFGGSHSISAAHHRLSMVHSRGSAGRALCRRAGSCGRYLHSVDHRHSRIPAEPFAAGPVCSGVARFVA